MNNIHGLGAANRGARRAPGGGGGGGGQSPGCLDQVKSGWASLPLFNQYIIIIITALYLIGWLTPIINYYLILIPVFVTQFHRKYLGLF